MSSPFIPGLLSSTRQWFMADALHAGDKAAWGELLDAHYPRVYRFFRARVEMDATAEKFASEVFLQAHRSIRQHDVNGMPVAVWLFEIAGGMVTAGTDTREPQPGQIPRDEPACHVRDQYVAAEVRSLIQRLPSQNRTALELRYMLGLSGVEAAAAMGMSAGGFRSLLLRATQTFREARATVRDQLPAQTTSHVPAVHMPAAVTVGMRFPYREAEHSTP